jgi:alpha-galactosidase
MMGKLGFDIVVSKLSGDDLKFCQNAVATYNLIKPLIWQGDQYRLSDPREESIAALMYVKPDKTTAVIFNYLVNNRYGAGSKLPLQLKGLDPAKKYSLKEINLYPGTKSGVDAALVYSGDFLMKVGFSLNISENHTSAVIQVEEAR